MKVVTIRSIVGVIRARRGYKKFLIDFINQCEIVDAISVPEGATNGDMIKAMFPNLEIANDGLTNDNLTGIIAFYGGYNSPMPRGNNYFNRKWWNAPYRLEGRK